MSDGTAPSSPAPDAQSQASVPAPPADAQSPQSSPAQSAPQGQARPPAQPPQRPPSGPTVVVRYGIMNHIGQFRHNLDSAPRRGAKVVVRTDRGVELGEVLMAMGEDDGCESCRRCLSPSELHEFLAKCGPEYPFHRDGRILRPANPQDIVDQKHLDSSAREELTYCRQQVRQLNLPMKLVTVEHLLGGERIIFYFCSEARVDFRELVRRLAAQYRTRIEMRQVGARDEARLVADYERCGQRCCCQEFLKDLRPVSMRMAKTQKATLDPSKISGRCGRLMCCLRYEDEGYELLRKKLPRKNVWVRTAGGVVGKVIDAQIITQLVRLWLPDNTQVAVPNEEISQRNVEPPVIAPPPERPQRPQRDRSEMRLLRDETAGPAAVAPRESAEPPVPAPEEPLVDQDEADLDETDVDEIDAASPAPPAATAEAFASAASAASGREQRSPTQGAAGQDAREPDGRHRRRRRRRRRHRGRGGPQPPAGPPQ